MTIFLVYKKLFLLTPGTIILGLFMMFTVYIIFLNSALFLSNEEIVL